MKIIPSATGNYIYIFFSLIFKVRITQKHRLMRVTVREPQKAVLGTQINQ